MNLVVNLTITPNLMFYLPGNQVKLVSLDNKVKLSYKSMQMWYTYELYVYDLSWVSKQHDVGIWRESYSGGEGPFKDQARLIRPPVAVQ